MTITPTGVPAQVRSANIQDYGGHADKRNYQAQGVVNPLTDVDATQFTRITADLAACARVAPFCVITVQCNDTAPAAPTVLRALQMGVVAPTGYAGASPPDANLPTLARDGDGAFTITWPATTTDDYGVSAPVDLLNVFPGTHESSRKTLTAWDDERTLVVIALDDAGDPLPDAVVTIEVS